MKRLVMMSAFILCPVLAMAQSNLNFPRLFTFQDRLSTGFAIVNAGGTDATVLYILNGENGAVLATATRTIPRGGQFSPLASELFPGVTATGWISATSATSGLQGFWVGGDFVNLTRADGAVAAPPSTEQVFPFVPSGTELSIANPSTNALSVTIKGYNDSGAEVGTHTRTIVARGISQFDIATIIQQGIPAYMRITGTAPFVSLAVLRGTSSLDNAVQNGIDVTSLSPTANTLVFPHFLEGVLQTFDYNSVLSVVNLANRVVTVHFQFVPEGGGPAVESLDYPLPPLSALKGLGNTFFLYNEFGFHNGHVRVTADGPIAGTLDYGTTGNGGEAIVPAQVTPQTNLMFAHIADLNPWFTGLAIQNPNNAAANIELFAMNGNGTLVGGAANVPTARITLAPGEKKAKLLSELIPQTQVRGQDGGFVFLRSNVPIHAIQLIFTRDQKILINISAVPVPAGVTYTPPNP